MAFQSLMELARRSNMLTPTGDPGTRIESHLRRPRTVKQSCIKKKTGKDRSRRCGQLAIQKKLSLLHCMQDSTHPIEKKTKSIAIRSDRSYLLSFRQERFCVCVGGDFVRFFRWFGTILCPGKIEATISTLMWSYYVCVQQQRKGCFFFLYW